MLSWGLATSKIPAAHAQTSGGYTSCSSDWTSGEAIIKGAAFYTPKKATGTGQATLCLKNGELYVLAYVGGNQTALSMVHVTLPEVP